MEGSIAKHASVPRTAHTFGRAEKREQAGSWWPDWMEWLKPQCGGLVDAPPVATEAFPALADAPGTYVLER